MEVAEGGETKEEEEKEEEEEEEKEETLASSRLKTVDTPTLWRWMRVRKWRVQKAEVGLIVAFEWVGAISQSLYL